MRRVGIVGNGADKFTPEGEHAARDLIRSILEGGGWDAMVSGHSPVGGVDIWAEEEAEALGVPLDLKIPEVNRWDPPGGYGFKERNLDIAAADYVHVIVADRYPPGYTGRRFEVCYHHEPGSRMLTNHVKSGGCWTGRQARIAAWHIVTN